MPTVLVVDDSESDRVIVSRLLEQQPTLTVKTVSNGAAALATLAETSIDLVLTDLRMPEMDGLELVRNVRAEFPKAPVILMTAHGSERIAVEALRLGAVSYVPKNQLSQRLLDTVEEVLAIARADRSHQRLIQCLTASEFELELENDPAMIPALVDYVQRMVDGVKLCDATGRVRLGVALEEALNNAMYHGNLEMNSELLREAQAQVLKRRTHAAARERRQQAPYCDRRVYFHAYITPSDARFIIRDQGPGFDTSLIPDPHDPGSLERASGRGLMLMHAFMDEVSYNAKGNEVTMTLSMIKSRDMPPLTTVEGDGARLFNIEFHRDTMILFPLRSIGSFAEENVQKELSNVLERLKETRVRNIVVDCSQIGYFGSSMLEAMRMIWDQVRSSQGRVAICNASPVIQEILEISRFSTIWPICPTRRDALEAVLS